MDFAKHLLRSDWKIGGNWWSNASLVAVAACCSADAANINVFVVVGV